MPSDAWIVLAQPIIEAPMSPENRIFDALLVQTTEHLEMLRSHGLRGAVLPPQGGMRL